MNQNEVTPEGRINERLEPVNKQPYEPPSATFVALRMEERVLACGKAVSPCYGPGSS